MAWSLRSRQRHTDLVTCSLCLRVRRGSDWVEAGDVIRELRSYEHSAAPRLQPGICEPCGELILDRRAHDAETIAA